MENVPWIFEDFENRKPTYRIYIYIYIYIGRYIWWTSMVSSCFICTWNWQMAQNEHVCMSIWKTRLQNILLEILVLGRSCSCRRRWYSSHKRTRYFSCNRRTYYPVQQCWYVFLLYKKNTLFWSRNKTSFFFRQRGCPFSERTLFFFRKDIVLSQKGHCSFSERTYLLVQQEDMPSLFNNNTCLLCEQEDMSCCWKSGHVFLLDKKTCLLVGQEYMSCILWILSISRELGGHQGWGNPGPGAGGTGSTCRGNHWAGVPEGIPY